MNNHRLLRSLPRIAATRWMPALCLGFTLLLPAARAQVANLAPKVAIVRPSPGEGFVNPGEIQIIVEAADADGYVQTVELFTDLGTLGAISPNPASASAINPFQWTWSNPPAGEHKLSAKATDNSGAVSFSESVVIGVKRDGSPSPATLTFVKPENGAVLPFPGLVSMQVTAVDPNGDIRHVEFFANGVFIGQSDHLTKDAVIPGRPREHYLEWKPSSQGFYQLHARALDTQDNPVESKPVSVTVGTALPIVSIAATQPETREPAPNIRVRPGAFTLKRSGEPSAPLTVFLRYEGSATPGVDYEKLPESVTFPAGTAAVELLVGAIEDSIPEGVESVIASLTEPPFDRLPDHIIDLEHQSAKVLIYDGATPGAATLEITAPKDGEVIPSGQTITINAVAIDPAGYIALVEFYDFDKLIGVSRIDFIRAPDPGTPIHHSFEWQDPPPGEHVITARAVDTNGNPVLSKPVRIQVGEGGGGATLEITSPKDGELFPAGETITLNAVAIDPAGYIARVEFYDYEKLIGVSQIYFIRAPDPGTPVHHMFEWQNPPPGEHLVTARAVDSKGDLVASKPLRIQVSGTATLPLVQITALDSEAMEFPPFVDAVDPARFSITRTGDLTKELYVVFSVHGTATPEKDFRRLGNFVRIPAGESAAVVEIVPLADELEESMETVALRLEDPMPISALPVPPTPYSMTREHRSATAVIFDQRRPEQGSLELALPGAGEVYQQFEALPLTAAAFHPSADIDHVDFYANGKLIGSSDVVMDKFTPGGLILHHFNWKDPLAGDQVFIARATLPDGSVLESSKISIRVQEAAPPVVTVEIEPLDIDAAEATADGAPDSAVFVVRRVAGPKDVAVSVQYKLGGTAENGVDYAPLDGKITLPSGESSMQLVLKPIPDQVAEGDETVVVELTPTPCPAIFPPPPWCYQIGPSARAKAVIRDVAARLADTPVVTLLSPQSGSVFTAGEAILISAVARTPSPFNGKLELWSDNTHLATSERPEISINRSDLPPGAHVLFAMLVDSSGEQRSAPAKIVVREVDTVAFVQRKLPAGYVPGGTFTVALTCAPPSGTSAYALEDQPPAGFTVSEISHDGVFDPITRRVKFGLFSDDQSRTLTYQVSAPAEARGRHEFAGSSSANGKVFPIGGDQIVSLSGETHPADVAPRDFAISLAELTGYGAAWKLGENWNVAPSPIPLSFVTRAGLLWKQGEKYTYAPAEGAAPDCWKSSNPVSTLSVASGLVGYAHRDMTWTETGNGALAVQVKVLPAPQTSAYGLQEQLPAGWTATDVSHDGHYDPKSNCVRWGVFLDAQERTVSYRAMPVPTNMGAPRGVVSFDGSTDAIGGQYKLVAEAAKSATQFKRIEVRIDGAVQLRLAGPADHLCTVEVSTDLIHWTELTPMLLSDGEIAFEDKADPGQQRRFYRTR